MATSKSGSVTFTLDGSNRSTQLPVLRGSIKGQRVFDRPIQPSGLRPPVIGRGYHSAATACANTSRASHS